MTELQRWHKDPIEGFIRPHDGGDFYLAADADNLIGELRLIQSYAGEAMMHLGLRDDPNLLPSTCKVLVKHADNLSAELTALRERVRVLEDQLEAFGEHQPPCPMWDDPGPAGCTCGFDAALAGGEEK